jgi:hypothetical protein
LYTGVCFAGDGGSGIYDVYWSNRCVGYSIQKDASKQVTLAQATQVAAQAFGAWSAATCNGGGAPSIKAMAEDPVECSTVQYNCDGPNQHVIIFRDDGWPYANDPTHSLALTTVTYDSMDGEIFDADMEINSSDNTLIVDGPVPDAGADTDGGGAYPLLYIMTHEAGHFLGLAHSPDANAVMYALYHAGWQSLTPDDVAGICAIYPPDGTRNTTLGSLTAGACDDTPRHGFTTMCGAGDMGIDCGLVEAGVEEGGGDEEVAPSRGGCTSSAVSHRSWTSVDLGLLGLVGAGFLARRRRLAAKPVAAVFVLAFASATAAITGAARDANASVSIAALFDELVRESSATGIVTPIEQRSAWENGRIYTYTHVRVEARVAGELPLDPWVRTMGGVVGRVGQRVEGEAVLALGQTSLLFLRPQIDPETGALLETLEVTARGQGQFPVVLGDDKRPRLASASSVGGLLPPAADRLSRVTQPPRLARDVLPRRAVDDATKDIAAAWTRLHAQ